MFSIKKCQHPRGSLLLIYQKNGCYTDCYTTSFNGDVVSEEFIVAFYTTFIFKMERFILKWLVAKPSTDFQANQLANREIDEFAAWHVESRTEKQILLCDFQQKTRSWLMVEPIEVHGKAFTRLYFGSAVIPFKKVADGDYRLGFGFQLLSVFHKLYSRLLLAAAKLRLKKFVSS